MLDKETLCHLYIVEQKTGPEIAHIVGVKSAQTIYNWLDRHGIPRRSRRDCQLPVTPPKELLEELYLKRELSIDDVALQVGSSESSISMLLDKYNIPKRNRWEKMAGWNTGLSLSEEQRKALSDFAKQRTGERSARYGVVLSKEVRNKISESLKGRFRGPDNPQWKDGKNRRERELLNGRYEYKDWRQAVFERDCYTCQMCNQPSTGNIEAHHIYPFADFPHLCLEIANGITLCQDCHRSVKGKELDFADTFSAITHQASQ